MSRPFTDLLDDFANDPSNWQLVDRDVQPSMCKGNAGGSSVDEVFRHKTTGEEIVRHTVYNAKGKVLLPAHLRPKRK